MARFGPRRWLNDNCVNLGRHLVQAWLADAGHTAVFLHSFVFHRASLLWDDGEVRHDIWTDAVRRAGPGAFEAHILLLPLHWNQNHWVLVVADSRHKYVGMRDSLLMCDISRSSRHYLVVQRVREWLAAHGGAAFIDAGSWSLRTIHGPLQTNGYDCGMHILVSAHQAVDGLSIDEGGRYSVSYDGDTAHMQIARYSLHAAILHQWG